MKKTLRAFGKKVTLLSAAFVLAFNGIAVAVPLFATQKASADAVSTIVYDALPSVSSPTNYPSVGYEATSTSEFGDYVHLGGTNRKLSTVTVTMSDWAKYEDYASNSAYSASNWSLPVTLNIYSSTVDGNGVPTTKLANVTQTITVPWRPASDYSYNGIAFNAVFDLSSKNVTLPDDVIVGVAFNTQSHGYRPTGQPGPYNSLNVAVPSGQSVSMGSDNGSDEVLLDSTWSGAYGVTGPTGVFRKDTGWSPYGTVAMQITATAPLTVATCATTSTVNSTSLSGSGWNMVAETRSTGHNELLANGLHVWTEGATSTDKAAGYYPVSFNLADLGEGFGLDATAMSGSIPPALQLTVDLDGNGTPEGNLVAEPTFYGTDTLWLSSNWTGLNLSSAPTTFNGGGTGKGGTVNAWLSAFPNAKVMAIGYSLGSGVLGDYKITKITADCTDYTFSLAAPTNLTPANGTVTNDPAFTDTWSVVEGAHGYAYRTANTMNGSDLGSVIYSDTSATQPGRYSTSGSTVTRQNGGTPEADYYWQVSAIDGAGNLGPWSVINQVTVDTTAPAKPVHQSPVDGAVINNNDFWFDWSDVSGAVSYEMQNSTSPAVDANGSFQDVMWTGDYQHIQPTASTAHSVGASGTWYWQVRAVDAAGNKSAWTTPWAITLDMTAPVAPTLSSPADGATVNGASVTQSWNASSSSDVNHYIYESYNDASASSLRWNQTVSGLSKTATNVADSTFWWRVKAVDTAGNESAWSPLWKLTVDNTAPTTPTNLGWKTSEGVVITSGSATNDENGVASWNASSSSDVDHYIYKYWNDISGNPYKETSPWTTTISGMSLAGAFNQGEGAHYFSIAAVDGAGNTSAFSAPFKVVFDKTAPTITVNSIANSTNTQPTITGTTSELGGDVTIIVDSVTQGTVTSDAAGNWSWTPADPLTVGAHTIVATATDVAGNTSTATTLTDQPYWKQFSIVAQAVIQVPTQGAPTPVVTVLQAAPAAQAQTIVTPDDTAVLGEQDSSSEVKADTSSDQAVAGVSDKKSADVEWNLFGIVWYWWLVALAVLMGLWWAIAAWRHRKNEE